jgi:DNA (cytosine-5)-methyltransferase 1
VKDYPSDINIIFVGEMKEFPCLYQANLFKEMTFIPPESVFGYLQDKIWFAFLNIEVILLLLLSVIITNCSRERSFSQMKKIKNQLWTPVPQEKLPALSIVFIQNNKTS